MIRKLVTYRIIDEINEHPNADALELARIDGWQCVVKKGEFQSGDSCIYFEIDSWLPADDDRFEFLRKSGVKKDPSGRERIRIRTMKLRKELSQGLALPWSMFPEFHDREDVTRDKDLSEELDVIKFERPEPKTTDASGRFPADICPTTDEERIQNLWKDWSVRYADEEFVPTLKLDGSSCTVMFLGKEFSEYWKEDGIPTFDIYGEKDGEVIVCSRKLRLKYSEDSHFWKAAETSRTVDALMIYKRSIAIQGECMGPGIQGNREKLNGFDLFVFNVYSVEDKKYWDWSTVQSFCSVYNMKTVPVLSDEPMQPFKEFSSVDEILEWSEGPSINNDIREGVVWKGEGCSFKSISNKFLLRGGD